MSGLGDSLMFLDGGHEVGRLNGHECRAAAKVLFLSGVVERLEARLARLERDVAREVDARVLDTQSVRSDVLDLLVTTDRISELLTLEQDADLPVPYVITPEGRLAMAAAD